MADKRPLDDRDLDKLFAGAREAAPLPSDRLIARILADAEAQMGQPTQAAAPARPRGRLAALIAGIGGWPSAAGLATATVAGLAIGLSAPDTLDTLSGGYFAVSDGGYAVDELLPTYDDLLGEG